MNERVNHPPHYTAGGIECIDALGAATAVLEGIESVCTANAIKYLWRWKRKNGERKGAAQMRANPIIPPAELAEIERLARRQTRTGVRRMNSLTERDIYGSAAWNGNPDFSTLRRYRDLLARLADYEDSGMEPDEVAELEGKKKFGLTPEDKHGK